MISLSRNKPVPLLFIIAYAVAMWGGQYALRGLWEPDEARYAYVAKEMDHSGSWLVPMRNGKPYTHKPPLMFWLMKAGTLVTAGKYNGVAARMPTLLGVIMALWVLSRLALKWFDPPTAWRAIFIASLSAQFWHSAGMAQIDMLLLGLEMMALYFLFANDDHSAVWRPLLAFCFMGLAVLAKGPVGFIIPAGIYVAVTVFSGRRQRLKQPYWLWGIPLALAFPAAWLAGIWLQGAPPQFFHELLFAQNIGRLTGEFGGHTKPFYYFLKYLIIDFLPWTFFIPLSLKVLRDIEKTKLKMLAAWIGFVVLFFSLSSSKRDIYILSVYPAMAMMVAAAWPYFQIQSKRWTAASAFPLMGLMIVIGAVLLAGPVLPRIPVSGFIFVPTGLVILAGSAFLINQYGYGGLRKNWFHAFVITLTATTLTVGMIVFPGFNEVKAPVRLARAAKKHLKPSQKLLLFQMNGEIMPLYSDRWGREIDTPEQLEAIMEKTGKGIVVFSEKDWQRLRDRFGHFGEAVPFRVGSKELFFLTYTNPGLQS